MAGSTTEIERSLKSLNRMMPKLPFSRVDEETVAAIQVRLREIESAESHTLQLPSAEQHVWSDSPRIYTFLRCIPCTHEEAVTLMRKTKINDYSIPIGFGIRRQLPVPIDEDTFDDIQTAFLSEHSLMKAETLTGAQPEHRRLEQGRLFLEDIEELGHGSSAKVQRVRHRVSKREFACKRIERGVARVQVENLMAFIRELTALRRLNHQHIVRLIASYSDETTHSLILLPVASETLESLLHRISANFLRGNEPASKIIAINSQVEFTIVRHAFGCLLSTLVYLQDHEIRHKDIKPLNVLISNEGRICLCDFGISLDYSTTKEATTEGKLTGFTPGYCAPEVGSGEPRNTLSEVWSLGRVFFDMIVVLRGRPVHHAKAFIGLDTEKMPSMIKKYFVDLLSEHDGECDDILIDHALHMVGRLFANHQLDALTLYRRPMTNRTDRKLVRYCKLYHSKPTIAHIVTRISGIVAGPLSQAMPRSSKYRYLRSDRKSLMSTSIAYLSRQITSL